MDWITSESGLNIDEAKGVLTSMIDLGILLMQESSYSINTKFTSKRLKLKLANVANFQEKDERAIAKKAVDEDRVFFIQAIIVRIMKSRKTLSHLGLIDEVIHQSKSRFPPSIGVIKKCIEGLIEKEYLERSTLNKDLYNYVS
jgi:hypothetical protein